MTSTFLPHEQRHDAGLKEKPLEEVGQFKNLSSMFIAPKGSEAEWTRSTVHFLTCNHVSILVYCCKLPMKGCLRSLVTTDPITFSAWGVEIAYQLWIFTWLIYMALMNCRQPRSSFSWNPSQATSPRLRPMEERLGKKYVTRRHLNTVLSQACRRCGLFSKSHKYIFHLNVKCCYFIMHP